MTNQPKEERGCCGWCVPKDDRYLCRDASCKCHTPPSPEAVGGLGQPINSPCAPKKCTSIKEEVAGAKHYECDNHNPAPTEKTWANRLSKIVKEQEVFPSSWGQFYTDIRDFMEIELAAARAEGRSEACDYIEANCILEPFVEKTVEEARRSNNK